MTGPSGWIEKHAARDGRTRFRVRVVIDGRTASLGLYDLEEDAADALSAWKEQRAGAPAGVTLATWGVRWLDARETDGRHRGIRQDRSRWRTYVLRAHFVDRPLRAIERGDVVRWVKECLLLEAQKTKTAKDGTTTRTGLGRRVSRRNVVYALDLLRGALQDAADEGLVRSNVARDVRVPRDAGSTDEGWTYLTVAEIAALGELRLSPMQRAAFTIAIYSGLRAGELWGLRWADVDLSPERPELVVRRNRSRATKNGRVRRVPLLRIARESLQIWKQLAPGIGSAVVFPSASGGCHAEGYDAGWPRVRRLLGIARRVRFHDLRHTCGSHLVMGSWGRAWSLQEVREFLGHSTIRMTERYAHLSPDAIHGAARETDAAGAEPHRSPTGATPIARSGAKKSRRSR